jgi:23S rRNA pseudouridine1911/1915/1917 synthase
MNDLEENVESFEDENFEELQIIVDPGQSSMRLDQFIVGKFAKVSRNRIQNAIEAGLITLNGKIVKQSYKICGSEQINIRIPKVHDVSQVSPEEIPLEIIYEDDDLMIINKAAGMIVHPAAGVRSGTLVNALAFYFGNEQTKNRVGDKERFGLVHRIDKETSGLLVISKNDYAHTHLSKQFFDHSIEREYIALVWGEPDPPKGRIEAFVGRDPKQRQRQFVFEEGLEGKFAATHYELIESFYYTSLIKCNLETGRTHQIRIHMKYIGHPLFNDEKYDGDRIMKGTIYTKYKQFVANCYKILPRFALHARSLGFIHPVTGKKLHFEVDMPDDFKALVDKWRSYTHYRKEMIEDNE